MGQSWEDWREMDIANTTFDTPVDRTVTGLKAAAQVPAADRDIMSVSDARSEALGIIERYQGSNVDLASLLADLGFRAIGGKLVPIDADDGTA